MHDKNTAQIWIGQGSLDWHGKYRNECNNMNHREISGPAINFLHTWLASQYFESNPPPPSLKFIFSYDNVLRAIFTSELTYTSFNINNNTHWSLYWQNTLSSSTSSRTVRVWTTFCPINSVISRFKHERKIPYCHSTSEYSVKKHVLKEGPFRTLAGE